MNRQLERLNCVPAFEEHLKNKDTAYTDVCSIMQVNMGSLCNQACKHCHVEGGPNRTDAVMSKEVLQACLDVFRENDCLETIDITGGAPEMNPNFEWFLREACQICGHVIVRCNLTILTEEKYAHLAEVYRDLNVEVFSSLPYYREKDTDRQRGFGVFEKSIQVLHRLNELGYGRDGKHVLNLVYNPGGAFLPPAQGAIEEEFRKKLKKDFDVDFTNLFAITNNPVGRFGDFLERSENLEGYMNTLFGAYNPGAEEGMMCRFQISVKWDGGLYDCDFNQAAGLPMEGGLTIFDLLGKKIEKRHIALANHCYGCTAGQGSSCGGATE